MSVLLPLSIFNAFLCSVSIFHFEKVKVFWDPRFYDNQVDDFCISGTFPTLFDFANVVGLLFVIVHAGFTNQQNIFKIQNW